MTINFRQSNFIKELKDFLTEKRREKKRGLRRKEGFLNLMTVQIQKFIQSKEVTGGSGHIEEKKVETEEEMKVVRVYALSRAGHHMYS